MRSSEQIEAIPTICCLEEAGRKPHDLYGDAGIISAENIQEAQAHGVYLIGPIAGGPEKEDRLHLRDFELDEAGHILRCPAGHSPCEEKAEAGGEDQASSQPKLITTQKDRTIAKRKQRQSTAEFKEAYKIRSGIEATHAEFKRGHGGGKLSVRGRPSVELSVYFKTAAMNVKRFVSYVLFGGKVRPKFAPAWAR